MSVHDLLIALLLPSADDAAEDLAYNVGRRLGGAVRGDDERARAPARADATPTTRRRSGSTPRATTRAPLTWSSSPTYLLAHQPFFARVVALPQRDAPHRQPRARTSINRNDLVGRYPWINGVKTGHTSRRRLRARRPRRSAGRDDADQRGPRHRRARPRRDANTLALLDYGFAHFRLVEAASRAGQVLARPDGAGPPRRARAPLIAADAFRAGRAPRRPRSPMSSSRLPHS